MQQEISDILGTFHDGGIEGWKGDYSELELTIGCPYLAETEKKGNEYFFLTLKGLNRFEFRFWDGQFVKDLNAIIDLDLEIKYSRVEDDMVKVSCNLWTKEEGHNGGELWVQASKVLLRNQDNRSIKPDELYELSNLYWNRDTK